MVAYESKLKTLLKSRKFWAAIAASTAVAAGYFTNQETVWQAIMALVGIMSAYSLGTGIEDNGRTAVTSEKSSGGVLPPAP